MLRAEIWSAGREMRREGLEDVEVPVMRRWGLSLACLASDLGVWGALGARRGSLVEEEARERSALCSALVNTSRWVGSGLGSLSRSGCRTALSRPAETMLKPKKSPCLRKAPSVSLMDCVVWPGLSCTRMSSVGLECLGNRPLGVRTRGYSSNSQLGVVGTTARKLPQGSAAADGCLAFSRISNQ